MNKIGNKVDVPFGKLLTRILEGIFFSWPFQEGEPLSLVSRLLGKAGLEGLTDDEAGPGGRATHERTGASLRSKPGPFQESRTLALVFFSCGLTERANPWHEGIPLCRFCVGSLRFYWGRMVFSTGN